ncbi:NRDE family protein [Halopseudomonas maritima]|uniref:NRDE family protein n=1 Tax=Halopseudomonas maritima TaxID=2918528 RepID=UPI001EEBBEC4|nr:NRDE family protein [Halopseudomonas maritima]UJJ32650.1 NRDE family protein [Halopseudomonas maritima]
MCLIAFAWQMSKHHRLTLIGNRDEFHRRPTRPLDWWDDQEQPQLLAGRDLEAGGTWLGARRDGRFAAVTNIRTPGAAKAPRSRGQLPLDFLQGSQTPAAFMQHLAEQRHEYTGFNLIVGDASELWFLNSEHGQPKALEPGVYGLSNADLDSPWPKTRTLREALAAAPDADSEQLLSLLADSRSYADDQLPATGISLEWERMLAPAFITGNREYGTRASSLLRIGQDGSISMIEKRFAPFGQPEGERLCEWA